MTALTGHNFSPVSNLNLDFIGLLWIFPSACSQVGHIPRFPLTTDKIITSLFFFAWFFPFPVYGFILHLPLSKGLEPFGYKVYGPWENALSAIPTQKWIFLKICILKKFKNSIYLLDSPRNFWQ